VPRAAVGQHTKCQPMISVLLIMPFIVSVQDHAPLLKVSCVLLNYEEYLFFSTIHVLVTNLNAPVV
jgi:hypothetical protein